MRRRSAAGLTLSTSGLRELALGKVTRGVASKQERDAEAWQAGMVAAIALAGLWVGGYAFPVLHSLPMLVAGPVIITGLRLYRSEIRAAGWWSVAVAALIALGAGLFLVSPSYIGGMLP
jgi:hypothetical protein